MRTIRFAMVSFSITMVCVWSAALWWQGMIAAMLATAAMLLASVPPKPQVVETPTHIPRSIARDHGRSAVREALEDRVRRCTRVASAHETGSLGNGSCDHASHRAFLQHAPEFAVGGESAAWILGTRRRRGSRASNRGYSTTEQEHAHSGRSTSDTESSSVTFFSKETNAEVNSCRR